MQPALSSVPAPSLLSAVFLAPLGVLIVDSAGSPGSIANIQTARSPESLLSVPVP
jgi:hypothetical protein